MKIKIYQINTERDVDRKMFGGFDGLKGKNPERELYDIVFTGDVDCSTLEDVFVMFNVSHPGEYNGRSLSVSDIVEVIAEDGSSKLYFCDSFGFKPVSFGMTAERIKYLFRSYVENDLAASSPEYVRDALDQCGCTAEEAVELGFDWFTVLEE